MNYEFQIQEMPAQSVASITRTVKSEQLGDAYMQLLPRIHRYLSDHDIAPAGPPFGRYHRWDNEGGDVEIGIPVPGPFPADGEIRASELPGGRFLITTHRGPYEDLPQAHRAIGAHLKSEDLSVTGAGWESYVTDPAEEPDSSKWETQVIYPLES